MKFIGYYAWHSFINTIKKLFKSWFIIFIIGCLVFGGLIGLLVAIAIPDDEVEIDPNIPNGYEDIIEPSIEDIIEDVDSDFVAKVTSTIALLAIIVLISLVSYSAGDSGGKIFQPADTVLLFSSPVKPQTVLMFRMISKLFSLLFVGLYIFAQIPNLLNAGLPIMSGFGLVIAYSLTLCYAELFVILLYAVSTTHMKFKRYIPYIALSPIFVLLLSFGAYYRISGLDIWDALLSFGNLNFIKYIPCWGFLQGIMAESAVGNLSGMLIQTALSLLGLILLAVIIWNIKCDFYEDAMAKSEEVAQALDAANEGGIIRRSKDRKDNIIRNELKYGWGANAFFFKEMYNRFRFSKLHYFTKTCITYTLIGLLEILFLKFVVKGDAPGFKIVAFTLGALAFFRSLGNSYLDDLKKPFFIMSPESTLKKLFYSLIAGNANTALDIFPATILSAVVFKENIFLVIGAYVFIVSIDYYSTTVGSFLDIAIDVPSAKMVKQLIQIFFIYFGLLPDIALILIFSVVLEGSVAIAMLLATILNLVLGTLFLLLAPLFIEPKVGKRTGKNMVYSYGEVE